MEDLQQVFEELGLTPKQAVILLFLSKLDLASVKEISKSARVHRQEVYPALLELQKLGLVEKKIGLPNQYKAVPLVQAINILLDRKSVWISEIKNTANNLISAFEISEKCKSNQEEYDFTLLTGIERFSHAMRKWTEEAKSADYIQLHDHFSSQMANRMGALEWKHRKDAKVRVVSCGKLDFFKLKNKSPTIELRFTEVHIPVEIAIFDNSRAVFSIVSNRSSIMQAEVSALTSNNPCFVKMVQNYFDLLWLNSKSDL